ncbi:MAG: hypothetical protein ACU0AT_02960 [Tranquillimonas sp.]|mgnify:CR=1 FL=1|jgi:hypothetical protein
MSMTALLLTALLNSITTTPKPLACVFPAEGADAPQTISLSIEDNPSLFDSGSWFQVRMNLTDQGEMKGAAGRFTAADSWDVLIRGRKDDSTRVAVGLRKDGVAVLKMAADGSDETTRVGKCRDFERYLKRWTS